jgi:DNA-binding IclR family transcriptional regulator
MGTKPGIDRSNRALAGFRVKKLLFRLTKKGGFSLRLPNEDYIVAPVFKAIKVLEFIAESGRDVSLTEVANSLGMPKTTVFRYLQTLSATMFLSHDADRDRYGIGMRFRNLARTDGSMHRLRQVAVPVMRELNQTFNETINLAIESDGQIVYIEIIESTRTLRMQARVGSRNPLHTTALGKAILAHLSDTARDALLARGLPEQTYRSIVDSSVLRRQLKEIRARGYAIEIGENEESAMCIGVPILDDLSYPIAAISLSAPEQRQTDELIESAGSALLTAGRKIAEQMAGG